LKKKKKKNFKIVKSWVAITILNFGATTILNDWMELSGQQVKKKIERNMASLAFSNRVVK
jgi:hypothetical protein